MQFKDLKVNYSVDVLDKKALTFEEAKVVSVGLPRFENKIGVQPNMVVDVTIEQGGKNMTYVFPSDANKAYNGNYMFCTDKNDVVADVKAMMRASETALEEVDKHKGIVNKCKTLLADLDPEQKEKQKTEERFSAIEDSMSQIKEMLKALTDR